MVKELLTKKHVICSIGGGLASGRKDCDRCGTALIGKEIIKKTIGFLRNSEQGACMDVIVAGATRDARAVDASSLRLDKIAQQWEKRRNAELSKSKVGTVGRR